LGEVEKKIMPPELKVYVKPGCPWCVQAVAFLRDAGFDFEEIDVTSDRERFAEMETLSGQTYAPTMLMKTDEGEEVVLADFDVNELKAFFTKHGIEFA
jgi:monothiol glutaredoxin